MAQVLFWLWINVAGALLLSAATVLLHVGSFATEHVRVASIGGLAISGLLFCVWCIASIAQRQVAKSRSIILRNPTIATAALMLSLLGLGVAASWYRGHTGGRVLVTTIALASAYFFGLLALAFSVRGVAIGWRMFEAWAAKSSYRMGVATTLLLVAGLAGIASRPSSLRGVTEATLQRWLEVARVEHVATTVDLERSLLCAAATRLARTNLAEVPTDCADDSPSLVQR